MARCASALHIWLSRAIGSAYMEACWGPRMAPPRDGRPSLHVQTLLALTKPAPNPQMVYFVRDPSKFVTRDNVGSVIFFGVLRGGDALHSLLQLMHGLYVPVVVTNSTWPETVKSDFTAQLHKFMANLTETVYEVKGKTILYIPQVGAGAGCRATRPLCAGCMPVLSNARVHYTRAILPYLPVGGPARPQNSGEAEGPGAAAGVHHHPLDAAGALRGPTLALARRRHAGLGLPSWAPCT